MTIKHVTHSPQLSSDLISVIVEYCVSLSHLDISSNTCVDDVTLCQLATCQNLTSLDISNCDRVTDGFVFAALKSKI